ncbi:MAG: phosphatase PAP2 family protein [Thermodesulfovibrionia bacterium]
MDTELLYFINRGLQNPVFDTIMPFITERTYIPFLLVIIPVFIKDMKRAFLVMLLCVFAVTIGDISANILKHIIARPRPCHTLKDIRLLVGCGGSFSMPSNHTVNAFTLASTFSHFFKKTAIPMFTVAMLIAFSRIYVGVHYPSDVLIGALWGGMVAGLTILLYITLKPFLYRGTED